MKHLVLGLMATLMMTAANAEPTATGDLGLVIERANGSVLLIDQSERAALARIDSQLSLDEKRDLADHVIRNDGDLEATRTQVEACCVTRTTAPMIRPVVGIVTQVHIDNYRNLSE